ncbi:MAG: CapA family protein [Pseudobutyrivibrio sp.]|nr:CapA family protein [Pseudobutyrivibrio sp.]
MRRQRSSFYKLISAVACISMLVGCSSTVTDVEPRAGEESQPEKIEIVDLSDAWDTILNNSTKSFIGGHPIDETFLSLVTSQYGEDVIEEIASYANFETPEIWYDLTGKSIHVLWYEYCVQTGIQNYSLDDIHVMEAANDDEIVIDFTGDLTLAEGVATTQYMDQQMNGILDCFSPDLLNEMQSADILMVNNEFSYTNRGTALAGKAYTFRADPSRVSLLYDLGVDIAGVANNHVYDYDETGFLDTLNTLDGAGMPYVGAGVNLSDAKKPVYFIIGGRKIAFVAATQIERTLNYTKEATGTSPGVLKCLHPEEFCDTIAEAHANADYVMVFTHWGTEGNANYGADQVALARAFVESGADVIIGGHTHCLQTMEYMDDVPIYYSLGNYYFSTTSNMPADYDTGLAQVRIKKDGSIETYFLPCEFSAGVTSLLSSDDTAYSDIINSLNDLSTTAVIDSSGRITKNKSE